MVQYIVCTISYPTVLQTVNLKQVVKENQLMEAAIIKVDKARFELKLSLRKSDTLPNPDKVCALWGCH